ncbi:response regulator [uncultured Aureimonas sp.]|uniref:response regulator n=1 Tax=uncultured Aureimonas sp. TaxID=1604662 RepID=UPI0025CC9754|nr:response regulator [uncultured Aureimonas sp.]
MRVLILEDEPLIAMDLEDIVVETLQADCVWASSLHDGFQRILEGVDFALLDFDLGGDNSSAIARTLEDLRVPFCFVSGSLSDVPSRFSRIPKIAKPYRHADIVRALTAA